LDDAVRVLREEGVIEFVEGLMQIVEEDLFACTTAIRGSRQSCELFKPLW
jgi:hypothetical protein